jgi:hypothetical protein
MCVPALGTVNGTKLVLQGAGEKRGVMPLQAGHVDDNLSLIDPLVHDDLGVGLPPRFLCLYIVTTATSVPHGDRLTGVNHFNGKPSDVGFRQVTGEQILRG